MTPLATNLAERLEGLGGSCHQDMRPHLASLCSLATYCTTAVEFGVRTGNSTIALLAGLEANEAPYGALHSYDIAEPQLTLPETPAEWTFTRTDTATLEDIPECDLLFIDTLHTRDQVAAELKHAHRARRFIVLHDVLMFGLAGEVGQPGILPPILTFLAEHPEWQIKTFEESQWGMLTLERKAANAAPKTHQPTVLPLDTDC